MSDSSSDDQYTTFKSEYLEYENWPKQSRKIRRISSLQLRNPGPRRNALWYTDSDSYGFPIPIKTEKKDHVSFGTSQSRPCYPMAMPPTRFGNEMKPIRGQPNTGPGAYESEDKTNFQYQVDNYLTSNKGYVMGARTGPRFRKEFMELTPAPHTYQTTCTDPMTFGTAYKPFNYAAERFPVTKKDVEEATPGAGAYDHGISRNRHVKWHQSFGGAPIKLPDVNIKSTIGSNTQKLLSTRDAKRHQRKLAYLKLYWE